MIVQLPPDMAVEMWPALAPLIKRATDTTNGCYEPADVLKEILNGDQLAWIGWDEDTKRIDIAITTGLFNYPRRKTCRVIFVGGDHMGRYLDEFMATIERYARENGASALEGSYRRGWVRAAGFKETGSILFKELSA